MRVVVLCTLLFVMFCASAQNKQLLYNVEDLPQTLLSNPGAVINFNSHIGIPFLSGFSVEAGSSGVSVYDIFRTDGNINVAINQALLDLDDKDYFGANFQLEILSFGWKSSRSEIYYSAGLYHEVDALIYFPKDIATLAYRGNADFINVPFEFSDVALTAESLSVYHFGINKKVNDSWQLGLRAKVYMSVANVNSITNRGDFTTISTPDGPNFYTHSLRNARLVANTSGVESFYDSELETDGAEVAGNAFLSENYGFGFDVGFTHFLTEQWTITGSLIDVGYVNHTEDLRSFSATANYETNGLELEFPALLEGESTSAYWEILEDEFEDAVVLSDSLRPSYTTWRPLKVNGSIQYAYGEDRGGEDCNCRGGITRTYRNKIGAHIYSVKRPKGFQTAITSYYDKTWNDALRTRITYTYDKRSAKNIGLLLSTNINKFNLYLAADNLLEYSNLAKARGVSLQLGMQLIFD